MKKPIDRESGAAGKTLQHSPSSNTDATKTVAADPEHCWVLESIEFGYDLDPDAGAGQLTVVAGSTTILSVPIVNGGAGQLTFRHGRHNDGALDEALVITLVAGGSGCSGEINATYR